MVEEYLLFTVALFLNLNLSSWSVFPEAFCLMPAPGSADKMTMAKLLKTSFYFRFLNHENNKLNFNFTFFLCVIFVMTSSCGMIWGGTGPSSLRSCQTSFVDQTGAGSDFGGGSSFGTNWSGAIDRFGSSNYMMLSQSGSATVLALDPSWVPAWSSIALYWALDGAIGAISNGTTIPAIVGVSGVASNGSGSLAYQAGKINGGISFASGGDAIVIPAAIAPNPTAQITIGYWAKFTTSPPCCATWMIGKEQLQRSGMGYTAREHCHPKWRSGSIPAARMRTPLLKLQPP